MIRRLAARTRVYEALPSLLLGMERPASHAERASAARASNGAWARVDASRGSWEAASSTNAGTAYDRRGFSFRAGLDAVMGEGTQAGVSVHWRRATAEVSQGGDIEARGVGAGLSATWSSGLLFVDGQAAVTLYEAELTSTLRGALKDGVAARGLSAALEAGRMVPVADGVTVTPRARVAYSSLSLSEFDDSVGARVSLDRGRSLTGRAPGRWRSVSSAKGAASSARWMWSASSRRRPGCRLRGHRWRRRARRRAGWSGSAASMAGRRVVSRCAALWAMRRPAAARATTAPAPACRCVSDRRRRARSGETRRSGRARPPPLA